MSAPKPVRLALAASALAALACASAPVHDPVAARCNPDAAFERGLADGKAGRDPDVAWLVYCDPSVHEVIGRSYGEGHAAGVSARSADAPPVPGAPGERAYLCEVQARGDTFKAYGQTRIAADAAARASCRMKNPEQLCSETVCRRNE